MDHRFWKVSESLKPPVATIDFSACFESQSQSTFQCHYHTTHNQTTSHKKHDHDMSENELHPNVVQPIINHHPNITINRLVEGKIYRKQQTFQLNMGFTGQKLSANGTTLPQASERAGLQPAKSGIFCSNK